MHTIYKKKLFPHGGSKAVDLPKEAFKVIGDQEVMVEVREDGVFIYVDAFTNLESDPRFHLFVEALIKDAMEHPEQLKNLEEVWDKEWDDLLSGVDGGDEI